MTHEENQAATRTRSIRTILLSIIALLMIGLTVINVSFSSVLTETCGLIHPLLFEVSVEVIEQNEDNLNIPFSNSELPLYDAPSDVDPSLIAINWESCLQYYGYTDTSGKFQANYLGQEAFFRSEFTLDGENYDYRVEPRTNETADAPLRWVLYDNNVLDDPEVPVTVDAKVVLSAYGVLILYLILPSLVIILPLFSVLLLRIARDTTWWLLMIVLIAGQSLTASLFYIQMADVSGVTTLSDFGTGIFTGIVTGTALAFMNKVLDNFSVADF